MRFKPFWIATSIFFSSQTLAQDHLEVQYVRAALSSGYDSWNDVNMLNYFGFKGQHFILETDYKNHFGKSAGFIGLTDTLVYHPLWYQDFSIGVSTDSSILPGWIFFTELHRKFLENQAIVGGFGIGHNISLPPYSDTYAIGEIVYYIDGPISLQFGARLNGSSPGSVMTSRFFGSFNLALNQWEAFLRYEMGREGYSIVSQNNFRREFPSRDEAIQLRYWLSTRLGVGTKLDWYQSEFYNRNQISLDLLYKY